MTVNDTLQRGL